MYLSMYLTIYLFHLEKKIENKIEVIDKNPVVALGTTVNILEESDPHHWRDK